VFFFQAEDGIRDWSVTGVQTCALPICRQDPRLRRAVDVDLVDRDRAAGYQRNTLRADRLALVRQAGDTKEHERAVRGAHVRRVEIGRASWRGRGERRVDVGCVEEAEEG